MSGRRRREPWWLDAGSFSRRCNDVVTHAHLRSTAAWARDIVRRLWREASYGIRLVRTDAPRQ